MNQQRGAAIIADILLAFAIDARWETMDDARDIATAAIMLRGPSKSCGYTGDTWVEIDRNEALQAVRP